jgi:hypothetical protein
VILYDVCSCLALAPPRPEPKGCRTCIWWLASNTGGCDKAIRLWDLRFTKEPDVLFMHKKFLFSTSYMGTKDFLTPSACCKTSEVGAGAPSGWVGVGGCCCAAAAAPGGYGRP